MGNKWKSVDNPALLVQVPDKTFHTTGFKVLAMGTNQGLPFIGGKHPVS